MGCEIRFRPLIDLTANVTANKGETAVHGDMAVRIRWVQARPWDGMRVTCLQFVLLETMNL